ncbi:hypothetical protein D9M68_843640 [compost metagenome]
MALSRTSRSLSCATSRLTSQARRERPAGNDSDSAASTARTSSRSMRQASSGLSSTPNSKACSHSGPPLTTQTAASATVTTSSAPATQASAPRTNGPAAPAGDPPTAGAMRRPSAPR